MLEKEMIEKLLMTMTTDIESNKKKIKFHFGNEKLINQDNQTLLHIFVDSTYDEEKCFLAIKTLLEMGVNPNHEDEFKYNFIQTALYTNYSESFILKIAEEAFKYGLNPNHQDAEKDTVIHTAIYSEDYFGGVEELLKLYIKNGFDLKLTCQNNNKVSEAMTWMNEYIKNNNIDMRLYTKEEIKRLKEICNSTNKKEWKNSFKEFGNSLNNLKKETSNSSHIINKTEVDEREDNKTSNIPVKKEEVPKTKEISLETSKQLEKYGTVLNNKRFISSPAIGREEELLRLMVSLAKEETTPMLIGESGVGKTAIADELAYRISIGAVPKFLQGKIVLEINPETLASNTKYTGEFEQKILNLMNLIEDNDVILLINEIHTIYGIGTSENNNRDLASIVKKYIDRKSLKIIGTTTKIEYDKYFSNDALKRRFDIIKVEEPKDDLLYTILEKTIIDFAIRKGINFRDESIMHTIINSLIEVTKPNCRIYDDKLCNPALAISIIDEAFANALTFEDEYLEEHHFIRAIEWCERIYPTSKQKVIDKLKTKKTKQPTRIIQFRK